MTVVNPKSISGINSITMASGSDNLLTIHANDTSEKVRVNSSGDVIVGSGVTLSPDGDIFATGITTISENLKVGTGVTISPDGDAFFTGVCTATSFVGSGANLTGISGVSVANQGDNRVITNTGTTDALNAEANLTFDGTTLKAETGNPFLELSGTTSNGGNTGIHINANANHWVLESDNYTSQNLFSIKDGTPDSSTARLVIDSSGNTTISSGNLVIGTSGKGIDFSATANASQGSASNHNELLDDYEEGTWNPAVDKSQASMSGVTYGNKSGTYTKIGRQVTVWFDITVNSGGTSGSGAPYITELPFAVVTGDASNGGYGAPQMRDMTLTHGNMRIYGNSSYFANSQIYLQQFNSSGGTENSSFNGSGRITGQGTYFTTTQTIRYVYKLIRLNLF